MKKTLLSFILAFALVSPAFAFGGKDGKRGGDFKEMLKELNLSEDQMKQLKEQRKGAKEDRQAMKQGREKMKELRQKLKQGFISNASDSELIGIQAQIQNFQKEKADKRFQKLLSMKKILNAEQRAKFMELRKKKQEKRKEKRRGRRGNH